MAANVVDGALLGGAHPVLDLGEGLLDRIEVGRVWRQIPEPCAGRFDEAAQGGRLVTTEIVHDDDVALAEAAAREPAEHRLGKHSPLMGPSNRQGAVRRSQRKAPRKVSVRQWPCGVKLRTRSPFGPHPASVCRSLSET